MEVTLISEYEARKDKLYQGWIYLDYNGTNILAYKESRGDIMCYPDFLEYEVPAFVKIEEFTYKTVKGEGIDFCNFYFFEIF